MRHLARLTFIVALAILVGGCGTGATTAPSAPGAALASPGAVSAPPTASPAPPSTSASESAAASESALTDVDDGATAGDTGPLLRITLQSDHPFRSNPISRFGGFRSPAREAVGGLT